VLLVNNDLLSSRAVADALRAHVRCLREARNAAQVLQIAAADAPDLYLLDLDLMGPSGLDVCRSIRSRSNTPIIVLSHRRGESDMIAAFGAGVDDYVGNPPRVGELVARIGALLRRAQTPRREYEPVIESDGLIVDLQRRRVRRDGIDIQLSRIEWAVLRTLVRRPDEAVGHIELAERVWPLDAGKGRRSLRVYITHLRRKLERSRGRPRIIVTEAGFGYRFALDETRKPDGPDEPAEAPSRHATA
jgi:two-component system KDP operon response regulator KdpE